MLLLLTPLCRKRIVVLGSSSLLSVPLGGLVFGLRGLDCFLDVFFLLFFLVFLTEDIKKWIAVLRATVMVSSPPVQVQVNR